MSDTHTAGIELVWINSYPVWQWKCSCGNGGYNMIAPKEWADEMALRHLEQEQVVSENRHLWADITQLCDQHARFMCVWCGIERKEVREVTE